jgi:putative hydrolase of the HAD superfamily
MAIRNIIFDLGGVFIDIHYHKTRDAFMALGVADFDALFQQSYSNPLFARLEKGEISPEDFYDAFRLETGLQVSNAQIANAWNAMLGEFRPGAVALLPNLRSQYRLFLLSNTNEIHHAAFSQQYQQQFGHAFDDHFEKAHYSHTLGQRKPDVACYQAVLQLHGLEAAETLFIDDTPTNIAGAREAGLHTLLLASGEKLEDQMSKYL